MHIECVISDTSMGDSIMLLHYAWHCKEICVSSGTVPLFCWSSCFPFSLKFYVSFLSRSAITDHMEVVVCGPKSRRKRWNWTLRKCERFFVAKNKNISQMKEITRGETNIKLKPGKLSTWKLECLEQRAGNVTRRLRHTWLCHNCLFAVNADCMMHYRKSGS